MVALMVMGKFVLYELCGLVSLFCGTVRVFCLYATSTPRESLFFGGVM